MNVPNNLSRSCLLAFAIFWIVILSNEGIDEDIILILFLSFIPIFMVASLVILSTVCPIFWFTAKQGFSKQEVFKTYHPYYVVIAFGLSVFGILSTNFNINMIAFFVSAFITTNQSWVWFAKEKTNGKHS
nr:hypothetical protein [uncultured Psychroserpens sp.]